MNQPEKPFNVESYRQLTNSIREVEDMARKGGFVGVESRGTLGVKSFDLQGGGIQGMTRFDGAAPQVVDATLGEIMGPEASHDGEVSFEEMGNLAAVAENATEFAVQAPNGQVETHPLGDLYRNPAMPPSDSTPRAA